MVRVTAETVKVVKIHQPHGGDGKQCTITGFTSYWFAGGGGGNGGAALVMVVKVAVAVVPVMAKNRVIRTV